MTTELFENKKLQQVFEKVWINPEGALADLDTINALKKSFSPAVADGQLLRLMLNVLLQRFEGLDLQQEKLLDYYTTEKEIEKAALLMVWCMYGYIVIGRLGEADKVRRLFTQKFNEETTSLAYACYYVFSCAYCEKNGYYEDHIRLAQEAETVLNKYEIVPEWHYSILCQAKNYRSRTYSNYARHDEAVEMMNEVEALIKEHGLSNLLHEQLMYAYVMHYENNRQREKAIKVLEGIVAVSSTRLYNSIAKYQSIANLINTYSLRNRELDKHSSEYKANREKQLFWINKIDITINHSFVSSAMAFYYYTKAGFLMQENELDAALKAIAKSILIFYRCNHIKFLAQAYTTAYTIYKIGAVTHADYRMAYKAARCSDHMRMMTDKYYKQLLGRRIESIELQFKIKEKELNEALLQQKITAMNKEVQLTTINLHEKIQVLDEIKVYVNSLKKKELETRQLINTIAKKIDSVKITEEEKATLQQKISDTNQQLAKILAEKFPTLSTLEIRMCGLFQTGMNNKELSKLYGQGEKSYEQHRYRIKKKINLSAKDNLVKYLTTLYEGNRK